MRIHPKYLQLVGDAILPIAGFFFWDWSVYFILLFYFLDLFSNEIITHLKSKKIVSYQGAARKKTWISWGIGSLILLFVVILLAHVAVQTIFPSIHFLQQIELFWTYEEFGIQQGYILLPIIALGAYQQYTLFFLRPAKQRTANIVATWKKHVNAFFLAIAASGIVILLSQFIILPEMVYVLGMVIGISAYRFFFPAHGL